MKHWNTKYPERFNLNSAEDYKKWRDEKLAAYPKSVGDLVVELGDMTAITEKEKGKIGELVELANMCVYTSGSAELSMDSLLALGRQLGVSETDKTRRHSNSDEFRHFEQSHTLHDEACSLAYGCYLLRFRQNNTGFVSAV